MSLLQTTVLKVIIALCVLFVSTYCIPILDKQLNNEWALFKRDHRKQYHSIEEENTRQAIWKANLGKIQKHNDEAQSGMHTYTLAMNEFGDMTNEEFTKQMNGLKMSAKTERSLRNTRAVLVQSDIVIPDAVDWRQKGYVTSVKNQGQCGSCWAFSATGSLEGQYFAKNYFGTNQTVVSLSEQNLIDCSGSFGNFGCSGGLMDRAFQYIQANNGIDTASSYPYEARNNACRFDQQNVGATTIVSLLFFFL
ncbi:unnamed protein product [Rotaria sp. Silwood1]|nr:unnamed protein product [Rotaria sp. Silwood1]